MIFGLVFSTDLITRKSKRLRIESNGIRAFSNKGTPKVPARSYGFLKKSREAQFEFSYRPWLILPKRTIQIPNIYTTSIVRKGLLNPSRLIRKDNAESHSIVFRFPPRYKTHEEV